MTNYFRRMAQLEFGQRTGIVLQADNHGSVLVSLDNDNSAAGLSWHKISSFINEIIIVQSKATPTMHQVAQASRLASLPSPVGGVPA